MVEPAGAADVRGLRPHLRHGREAGRRRRAERPGHHGPLRADARPCSTASPRLRPGAGGELQLTDAMLGLCQIEPLPRAGLRRRPLRHRQQAGLAAGHGRGGAAARGAGQGLPRRPGRDRPPGGHRLSLGGLAAGRRRPAQPSRGRAGGPAPRMGPILGRRRYPPQRDPPRRRPAGGPGGLPAVAGGDGQPARRARPRHGRGRARGRGRPALRQHRRRRLRRPGRRRHRRRRSSCGWSARIAAGAAPTVPGRPGRGRPDHDRGAAAARRRRGRDGGGHRGHRATAAACGSTGRRRSATRCGGRATTSARATSCSRPAPSCARPSSASWPASGLASVRVVARPRVGVLSTGDELVEDGGPLGARSDPGEQPDDAARRGGPGRLRAGRPRPGPRRRGGPRRAAWPTPRPACDAVVTSGGVSMGDFDIVKAVLGRLGRDALDADRHQPAKPFAFGLLSGPDRPVPVFGLPGNPVSSLVSFELLARPALRQMMGHPQPRPAPRSRAVADEGFRRRPDGKIALVPGHRPVRGRRALPRPLDRRPGQPPAGRHGRGQRAGRACPTATASRPAATSTSSCSA